MRLDRPPEDMIYEVCFPNRNVSKCLYLYSFFKSYCFFFLSALPSRIYSSTYHEGLAWILHIIRKQMNTGEKRIVIRTVLLLVQSKFSTFLRITFLFEQAGPTGILPRSPDYLQFIRNVQIIAHRNKREGIYILRPLD